MIKKIVFGVKSNMTNKLSELTWEEIKYNSKKDEKLIIPIGTCEQHGKHLPLNTDTLIAEYMAEILSKELGIMIAPTVNYGINLPCDRYYSGTSSIDKEVLSKTIHQITDWGELQGFKKFFLITAHGDPFHIEALKSVKKDIIHVLEIYDVEIDDILEKQTCVKHACEAETSVMLYLFPDKVRTDIIYDFETPFEEFIHYLEHRKDESIENSPGCQGYPSFANPKKGKFIFERIKEKCLKSFS